MRNKSFEAFYLCGYCILFFDLKSPKQTDLHNKLPLRADVICIYITDVTHWGYTGINVIM